MGRTGRAAGAGWNEKIADGREDTDEPLQVLWAIESLASPALVGGTADANSPPGC